VRVYPVLFAFLGYHPIFFFKFGFGGFLWKYPERPLKVFAFFLRPVQDNHVFAKKYCLAFYRGVLACLSQLLSPTTLRPEPPPSPCFRSPKIDGLSDNHPRKLEEIVFFIRFYIGVLHGPPPSEKFPFFVFLKTSELSPGLHRGLRPPNPGRLFFCPADHFHSS